MGNPCDQAVPSYNKQHSQYANGGFDTSRACFHKLWQLIYKVLFNTACLGSVVEVYTNIVLVLCPDEVRSDKCKSSGK